ncbi:MAG: hypothetical protein N2712_07740 [Brevinematales bacterium]|nr:hypothetical protein [Brevinematales bacterium]
MKRYILFLIFFYFLSSSYCYFLQDLLNITTSAREKGLGGRFTSDIEVLSASKFNPSILGFIDKKKLVLD